MAGGLMQLVAYGAQDVFLTGNPSVTFFQAVYKRYTNFAMENIVQIVDGSISDSSFLSVQISRKGDLLGDMYLELTPLGSGSLGDTSDNSAFTTEWLAERAVQDIEFLIGGQRVDKHYQKWWRLYSELFLDDAKRQEWGKMTSFRVASITSVTTERVFLPLLFFFNRNPGLYLPLIALQYAEVSINLNLSSTFTSYFATGGLKVWANYIFLDSEERKRFANKKHEYLIEQLQHTGNDAVVAGGTVQNRLNYNHPVKELVWCFSSGAGTNDMWDTTSTHGICNMTVDPTSTITSTSLIAFSNIGMIYSGTDEGAMTANILGSSLTSNLVGTATLTSNITVPFNPNVVGSPHLQISSTTDTSTAGFWLEEPAVSVVSTYSVGPMSEFKLILNGEDRFKAQGGKYFNQVQPYYHHSGNPYPGIYSYSFALKPEEHQPTGSCNFSRIDTAQAEIKMKSGVDTTSVNMFAVNYNILRIESGMGGLAFSN